MFERKKFGTDLIDSVVSRFNVMIKELEEGIDHCRQEQDDIHMTIERLHTRDTELGVSTNQANKIATNLRNLMGVEE